MEHTIFVDELPLNKRRSGYIHYHQYSRGENEILGIELWGTRVYLHVEDLSELVIDELQALIRKHESAIQEQTA